MAEQARPSGLVVTDDSGNYYYLRPEVLAQAKMPDEDVKKLKSGLSKTAGKSGELSMDDMQSVAGGMVSLAHFNLPTVQTTSMKLPTGLPQMSGTVMCPW